MKPRWKRSATLVALSTCAVALPSCGGGSGATSEPLPTADVPLRVSTAIIDADLGIDSAARSTRSILRHPQAVRKAKELAKPLIVAKTLRVKSSNQVAGGLVDSLSSELDETVPGLTTQTNNGERLNSALVHRLFVYGEKDPTQVFHQQVAGYVGRLERLLRHESSNTLVIDSNPPATAHQVVSGNERVSRRYWPDEAKRLSALDRSLR